MIKREIKSQLLHLAAQYPVVTVMGPRQAGKTTLVKTCFPHMRYFNLEDPDIRNRIQLNPREFLEQHSSGLILDEIQRMPELLSYIQVIVDEKKEKGLYILTGSQQLALHEEVSQSLAGRTALLDLLPLSLSELKNKQDMSADEMLLKGFFPRIYNDNLNPTTTYRDYFRTYVERDVRKILNIKDLNRFQSFIRLCATRIGQPLNMESFCNDLGISNHTASSWLSVLEASFLIFRLQPYFENFGKRIIKAPKLYFIDPGLATYLLGITETEQISRDPLRGNLFENLVIVELLKAQTNRGQEPWLYYFRDKHGHEIDALYKQGNQIIPIEIKSSTNFSEHFLKNIHYFKKLTGERCQQSFLIYAGENEQRIGHTTLLNYKNTTDLFIKASPFD